MAKLPSVDEILTLIRDGKSRADVAEMFEVTEQAVYKKLKRAGKIDPTRHRIDDALPWEVESYHKRAKMYEYIRDLINLDRGIEVYPPSAYQARQAKADLDRREMSVAYDRLVGPNPASPVRGGFYEVPRKPGDQGIVSMPGNSTTTTPALLGNHNRADMPSTPTFPAPPDLPGLEWSISIDQIADRARSDRTTPDRTSPDRPSHARPQPDRNLFAHDPDRTLRTASVGKIFLLIEVCTRFHDGRLDPADRLQVPAEYEVADSGLLYLFRDREITLDDACLLVGAVSDNLATNGLLALCGLKAVRAVAPALGLEQTSLLDFIRDERTPELPWTPSYGTAGELSGLMRLLQEGTVVAPEVSARVLRYLAADTDVSMVAGGFHIDPLAHIEADGSLLVRHKTGSDSQIRVDVGLVAGPAHTVSYAVGANWPAAEVDHRVVVEDYMRSLGEAIRALVLG